MSPNKTEAPASRTRAAAKGNAKADPKAKADEPKKRQLAGNPSGEPVGTRGLGPLARASEATGGRGRKPEIDASGVVASASPPLMNRDPSGSDEVSQSPKTHKHAHVATDYGTAGSTSTWSGVDNVGSSPCGSSDGQVSLLSAGQPTPVPVAETGFAQLEASLASVLAILDERTEAKKRVVPERLVNRVGAELAKVRTLAQKYVLDNVRLGAQVEILVAQGTPKQRTDSRSRPEASRSRVDGASQVPSAAPAPPPKRTVAVSGGGPSEAREATFAEVTRRRRRVPKPPPPSACVGGPGPSARVDGAGVAGSRPVAPRESVVIVKEVNDTGRTGQDIRAQVTRVEDLRRARLRVHRVSAVHKAVVIEVRDSESRQKILSSSGLREAGLIATVKEPQRPEIKVYDCPRDMSDAEIHRDVVELNLAKDAERWECDAVSVTVAHRVPQRRGKLDTVFLKVTPEARAKLLSVGRISVGWRSCRVADHTHVARCHKCQRLGHVQKFCREDRDVCVHCGGVGHKLASCKKRDSPPKCANCRDNRQSSSAHRADSLDCPARARALAQAIARTQYAVVSGTADG